MSNPQRPTHSPALLAGWAFGETFEPVPGGLTEVARIARPADLAAVRDALEEQPGGEAAA